MVIFFSSFVRAHSLGRIVTSMTSKEPLAYLLLYRILYRVGGQNLPSREKAMNIINIQHHSVHTEQNIANITALSAFFPPIGTRALTDWPNRRKEMIRYNWRRRRVKRQLSSPWIIYPPSNIHRHRQTDNRGPWVTGELSLTIPLSVERFINTIYSPLRQKISIDGITQPSLSHSFPSHFIIIIWRASVISSFYDVRKMSFFFWSLRQKN